MSSEAPVIIGGVERSGTSLLRAILGSHPDLAIFQWDLPLWRQFYHEYKDRDLSLEDCRELVYRITGNRKAYLADSPPQPDEVLQVLREAQPPYRCENVFGAYLRVYAGHRGRPRWGLKTPSNEFYTSSIFEAFPDAHVVHVIRDPRDVVVSMMKTEFVRYMALSLNPLNFETSGVLAWWQMSAEVAHENQEQFPTRYHVVKYENLTGATVETVSSLCETCGLDYTDQMLNMNDHPGWEGGNSPLDQNRAENRVKDVGNRYPKHLEPHQIAFLEDILGEAMQRHGYQPDAGDASAWKTATLHANYAVKPGIAGLRAAYRGFRRTYHAVMDERRRQSTDDLSDY
jgi:hypothetical protein